MTAQKLLESLDGVRQTGASCWIARCPAHDDCNPSLSVTEKDGGRTLVHCFAGCAFAEILDALGMRAGDLMGAASDHSCPPLSARDRKRYGQARDALKALAHECIVVWECAEQVYSGFALDPDQRKRLGKAIKRIRQAEVIAS